MLKMQTARQEPFQILKNGHLVVETAEDGDYGIVLAKNGPGGAHRYVTWQYRVDEGATYWGRYWQTLEEAISDFHNRIDQIEKIASVLAGEEMRTDELEVERATKLGSTP